MGFSFQTSIPALTVFVQGLLSFFSPCVLPLVPLYISYLAGGADLAAPDGTSRYPRRRVLIHTFFFVLGISFAFFALGLGVTALGRFFRGNRLWFAQISGAVMIFMGLYQFGVFGRSQALDRERRMGVPIHRWAMGPVPALVLGFTFSFAWTPCVGPALGSVLLMAGSSGTMARGFMLIGIYTIGFILPFLAVGLFTGKVLDFFQQHRNVVQYTVKAGAALLVFMGIMTLTGMMNGFPNYLSDTSGQPSSSVTQTPPQTQDTSQPESSSQAEDAPETFPAPEFTLADQFGAQHTLSDYKGKTVFLNFWATWCGPCKNEMPEIEALYQRYDENTGDVIVLGVAAPNLGREGSAEEIQQFLSDHGYTFPVVMDADGSVMQTYGIRAFPTTFMIDNQGNLFGYVERALTGEMMEDIIQQTIAGRSQG